MPELVLGFVVGWLMGLAGTVLALACGRWLARRQRLKDARAAAQDDLARQRRQAEDQRRRQNRTMWGD
jgi:hypothetical protein